MLPLTEGSIPTELNGDATFAGELCASAIISSRLSVLTTARRFAYTNVARDRRALRDVRPLVLMLSPACQFDRTNMCLYSTAYQDSSTELSPRFGDGDACRQDPVKTVRPVGSQTQSNKGCPRRKCSLPSTLCGSKATLESRGPRQAARQLQHFGRACYLVLPMQPGHFPRKSPFDTISRLLHSSRPHPCTGNPRQ